MGDPDSGGAPHPERIDIAGLLCSGAALLGLTYALIEGHRLDLSADPRLPRRRRSAALLRDDATFTDVLPALVIIGIGGGFTTSLTATVVGAKPPAEAEVASAVFNTVRQLGGLLGITTTGAVLTIAQSNELRHGSTPGEAFLSGHHLGLIVAAAFVAAGALTAYLALARPGSGRGGTHLTACDRWPTRRRVSTKPACRAELNC